MSFTLVNDYTPSGGPVAASANPGSIGNGYTDVAGNNYSISAANTLQSVQATSAPWNTAALARLNSSELSVDSQITIRWTPGSIAGGGSSNAIYAMPRYSNAGATPTAYVIGATAAGGFKAFPLIAGSLGTDLTVVGATGSYTVAANTSYDYTVTTTQINTSTIITASIFNTSGTLLGTQTWTDSNAPLQNLAGNIGLFFFGLNTPQDSVARIRTYIGLSFFQVSNYTPSGGPIAASANPGSIGNGYTDVAGNVWSITSANILQSVQVVSNPWDNAVLTRNQTSDNAVESRQSVQWIPGTTSGGNALYAYSRYTNPGTTPSGYITGVNTSGSFTAFRVVAGSLSSSLTIIGTAAAFTITPGIQYQIVTSNYQVSSTATILSASLYLPNGSLVASQSWYDNTSSLQNVTGKSAFFTVGTGTPQDGIASIKTFSKDIANATGYVLSVPAPAQTNVPISITVNLTGGNVLTAPLVVSISEDSNGVISPTSLTLISQNGSASSLYTPKTAGTRTLTTAHTGGNSGMSGDGSQSFTVFPVTVISMTDSSCVSSPYNWSVGSAGPGSLQTWNPGAYARFYVKGCTSATILLDATVQSPYIRYAVDKGPLSAPFQTPNSGQTIISIPDTGSHVVFVTIHSVPQSAGRWNRSLYVGLQGMILGAGGIADVSSVVRGTKNILFYGDSITEGILANNGTDGNTYDYSYLIGQSLFQLGFEYGIVACGSQGYTQTGAGSVPPVFTPGNDTLSAWNKVDTSNSRLTSGKILPSPDVITDNHGTNDQSSMNLPTVIPAFYTALRAAAPYAKIIKIIPYGGYKRTDILSGIANYQAASPDSNQVTVDLGIDLRMTSGSYTGFGDNVHPGTWGHANISTLVMGNILPIITGNAGSNVPKKFFP